MVTIAAYYYPGWHKRGEEDEWNIVKTALPYFEGHHQPRIPLLGYLDDSQTSTLETQTKIATDFGIDAFIFDWYWKNGEVIGEGAVKAFLETQAAMKFAFMWAWKIPRKRFPLVHEDVLNDHERWVNTSTEDFLNLLDYCNSNYFGRENYWTVEGKPYFVMYCAEGFLHKLGAGKLTAMLDAGDEFLKRKGHAGLHAVGVITDATQRSLELKIPRYGHMGFRALTGYNFLPDFQGQLLQDYAALADKVQHDWSMIRSSSGLPYIPSISTGWDATPRGMRLENITRDSSFPWAPIVVNATPENFAKNLVNGLRFNQACGQDTIHICSWNEWSEGAHLEPDVKYGFQFLERIRESKALFSGSANGSGVGKQGHLVTSPPSF